MRDRTVDTEVSKSLDRLGQRLTTPVEAWSAPVDVVFPSANTRLDVAHGMGAIPSGYWIVRADAPVYSAPAQVWTRDLAYLQSSTAGARATVLFVVLKGVATT